MINERKLKSKMALMGITQKDLAAKMKKAENTISAKLSGKSRLYLDEIDDLCVILEISSTSEKAEIFLNCSSQYRDEMRRQGT